MLLTRHACVAVMIFATLLAVPAKADTKADATISAFRSWLSQNGVKTGAIAVAKDGEIIASDGLRRSAADPAPVASLSKAITARCAFETARSLGKGADSKLASLIPAFLAKVPPADARLAEIRLGQLIAHTSGLAPDITQTELKRLRTPKKENMVWQFTQQAKLPLKTQPGLTHFYSNSNYLALGLAIEEMSGKTYEAQCNDIVFAPLGIDARLNPDWKVMSAYGGWMVSAEDYLTFALDTFKDGRVLGERPTSLPKASLGRGRSYGMGAYFRRSNDGMNFWHFGRWGGYRGHNAAFGAYFAVYDNGYAVSVNYRTNPNGDAMRALDNALWTATHD